MLIPHNPKVVGSNPAAAIRPISAVFRQKPIYSGFFLYEYADETAYLQFKVQKMQLKFQKVPTETSHEIYFLRVQNIIHQRKSVGIFLVKQLTTVSGTWYNYLEKIFRKGK